MALDFPVVGIGASAGGIFALQSLFRSLPSHTGLAFVVVQHLSPAHASQLVPLLREATQLTVCEALDGATVERDRVYVAGPGQALTISGGVLSSRAARDRGIKLIETVDTFFASLASDQGENAVGVVLSGSGSDGAAGAVQIRLAGGVVFAQDPATATHDSMPRAAIASGAVDRVLRLEVLGQALLAQTSRRPAATEGASWKERTEEALDRVRELVRAHAGIDLGGYKSTPLLWRIQRRMDLRRIGNLPDYARYLERNPSELEALVRGIPIHVTSFFRDGEAWKFLAESVIAPMVSARRGGPPIRAWTAACSSGEEAYSLAMVLSEATSAAAAAPDFQVFATDASAAIVARAGRGWFTAEAAEAVSPERRARFFDEADGGYRVKKALRSKLVFARHDLLRDPPFSGLDLVTCRNLLIYMAPPAQEQVLSLLSSALGPGGVLFLGSGEALDISRHGFEVESKAHRVYRRLPASLAVAPAAHLLAPAREAAVAESAHLARLAGPGEAGVLVDGELTLLHVYGDMEEFLRLPQGEPRYDLPGLLRPGLLSHVRSAVHWALDERRPATTRGLWQGPRGAVTLNTRVTPIEADGSLRLLISLETAPASQPDAPGTEADASARMTTPTEPPAESTRLSNEELEASREELHAVNEELRSVNDQLNFVNERLAETNDQLNTANERLQAHIEELETQRRVLSSSAVITLFLDEELCVRWFTPAVQALFPLRLQDVGRSITDFVPRFKDASFLEDVRQVLASGEPRESEMQTRDGRWYARQVRPHPQSANHPGGVVVTFNDVTARRAVEDELRQHQLRLRLALETAGMGVALWDMEQDRTEFDARTFEIFGAPPGGTLSQKGVFEAMTREDAEQHVRAVTRACDPEGDGVLKEELHLRFANDEERWVSVTGQVLFGGEPPRARQMVGTVLDITERKALEAALRASEARQRFLLELTDALRPLTDAAEIEARVTRLVGEQLGASRACYVIMDVAGGEVGILHDYCANGVPSLVGVHRLQDFIMAARPALAGDMLNYSDCANQPELPQAERERMVAMQVGALLSVPVVKGGVLVGLFSVTSEGPRQWTRDEAALLKEVAERTWDAIARGNTEAALRDSEQRFRLLVQSIAQATWETNAQGLVVRDSPSWRAYTGQTLEQWLGDGWMNAVHPDDRATVLAKWREAVAYEREFDAEYRLRNPEGGYTWTNVRAAPLRGADGTILRWVGMNIDITDRKQAEALRMLALEGRSQAHDAS